jgi:hypothetical protein
VFPLVPLFLEISMRFVLLLALLIPACLAAQAPSVVVTNNGAVVPNAGGFQVDEFSAFNSAGISLNVTDPQNDPVSISAVVSNTAAAVNWDETNFNKASTVTPYIFNVAAPNGEFGPENTVHVVILDLSDGTNVTQVSFTISVVDPGGGGGNTNPGSPGGSACAAGTAGAPFALAVLGALFYRRKRITWQAGSMRASGRA